MKCIRCGWPFVRHYNAKYCMKCVGYIYKTSGKAYSAVKAAMLSGDLPHISTQYCVDCGAFAETYDHTDYSKPLEVQPVCKPCNRKRGPTYRKVA